MHHFRDCRTSCSAFDILLGLFSVSALFCTTKATKNVQGNHTIPAVFAFGDSIVDAGTNNNLITIAKCNFPPYGRDFLGGKPTGRFSNGKVPSDLLVEKLGIKKLLPSYSDPNLQTDDLLTGVTFASGASGYDPLTSEILAVLSMSDQLKLFRDYIEKLEGIVGRDKARRILEKSLFLVVSGSNDIANTYFACPLRKLQYDVDEYADFLVSSASAFLKDLYALGARKIGVFGLPPIGCLPSQRTLQGGILRRCGEPCNNAAQLFNSKLSAELSLLESNLPHSTVIYVDIYNPILRILEDPEKYGFEVIDRGCCGTGTLEASILCTKFIYSCMNASKYVFWDSFHPSERTYKFLVSQFVKKYGHFFFV